MQIRVALDETKKKFHSSSTKVYGSLKSVVDDVFRGEYYRREYEGQAGKLVIRLSAHAYKAQVDKLHGKNETPTVIYQHVGTVLSQGQWCRWITPCDSWQNPAASTPNSASGNCPGTL
ncbi:hypothetical protein PHYPSEUDO_013736 [Phytophthora pseudosyringae]|uniref:Uncharacterized protein n=1 Tax=Phytophthora pseudosyringae TaxID=221518 RepID=A0A8T1W330_9STRA|nr:hypothetical protein PHYPSEUDO_013736 [Phytophthora pseudosyringae]